tara:strand:- start:169 stop:1560 length:1392 start_codon:yes stop_codon:yes gene_type:complete
MRLGYEKPSITNPQSASRGFTLIELLLSIGVTALLMIALTGLLRNVAEEELAITSAEYFTNIAEATQTMMSDHDSFDAIYNQTFATANNAFQLPLSSLADGFDFGGGDVIPASAKLSSNFSRTSPLKADIAILFAIADDPSTPLDPRALHALIITQEQVGDLRAFRVAELLGGSGAVYRDDPTVTGTVPIQGVYGFWDVPFSAFSGTSWHTDVSSRTFAVETGSYTGYYMYVNEEDVLGDYLYRTAQNLRPDLHTMNATLNMANYHLLGVDNAYISGNTTISGDIIAQGSAYVRGTTDIAGSYLVDHRVTAGDLTISDASGNAGDSQFFVQDRLTVGSGGFNVEEIQTPQANLDEFRTHSLDANTINIANGNVTINHPDGAAISQIQDAGTLTVSERVRARTIRSATDFTQNSGTASFEVIDLNNNNFAISGDMNVLTQFDANGTVNITELNDCENGCNFVDN